METKKLRWAVLTIRMYMCDWWLCACAYMKEHARMPLWFVIFFIFYYYEHMHKNCIQLNIALNEGSIGEKKAQNEKSARERKNKIQRK